MTDKGLIKRLRMAVASIGKQKDAAKAIGITDARLSNYLRGINTPGLEIVERLAAAAGVRSAWLADGMGPMSAEAEGFRPVAPAALPNAPEQPPPPAYPPPVAGSAPAGSVPPLLDTQQCLAMMQAMLGWLQSSAPRSQVAPPSPASPPAPAAASSPWRAGTIISRDDYEALPSAKRRYFVPILAHSTGGPAVVSSDERIVRETAEEYVMAPAARENAFAARISGKSMLPDFPDGCVVLVGEPREPDPDLSLASLVVYEDRMGTVRHTVKVVTAEGDTVHLRPLNPQFGGDEPIPRSRVRKVYAIMPL